ncbi:E3 ubiquitin-protein ligase RNF183-like [Spea bombifrons]|uniref:E3 ubiquitin-protein ligase RNF183-like n=1 Tax=Spea bombifrons TaxID=233779 RepID=UPI002348F800|nr:E3 ubiquitin-protein ligase RNF183-like [Spea bombifrons]
MADGAKLDPEYECPVCWNPYNNTFRTPKLLECRHSFCMECLARISIATQVNNHLQCPLCRHTTSLRLNRLITDLPTNTHILSQMKLPPQQQGRHLCVKDARRLNVFTRPPSVYTLGVESRSMAGTQLTQPQTPLPTIPSDDSFRHCLRNPQFRMFAYLMMTMLVVSLLLIFSIFWTRKFFWGPG